MQSRCSLTGWFVGTCTNSTAHTSANLLLRIHGATETRIHGELSLFGDLGGGGPFHGTVQGETVRFTTCLPALQIVIEWDGRRTGDGMAGTYEVWSDHPEVAALGLQRQTGVWACALVSQLDAAGANRTELVWVFHDGQSEGPLTVEVFLKHTADERWPSHALAARENCTVWCTVGELRDSLATDQLALN